tara:strand:+ start:2790 stop:2957 length:168 start_codon:yes stop_codon:yes gene_type:complete
MRPIITTTLTGRPQLDYIVTESLDFLMTEDDKFLVTEESISTTYTGRTPVVTNIT